MKSQRRKIKFHKNLTLTPILSLKCSTNAHLLLWRRTYFPLKGRNKSQKWHLRHWPTRLISSWTLADRLWNVRNMTLRWHFVVMTSEICRSRCDKMSWHGLDMMSNMSCTWSVHHHDIVSWQHMSWTCTRHDIIYDMRPTQLIHRIVQSYKNNPTWGGDPYIKACLGFCRYDVIRITFPAIRGDPRLYNQNFHGNFRSIFRSPWVQLSWWWWHHPISFRIRAGRDVKCQTALFWILRLYARFPTAK